MSNRLRASALGDVLFGIDANRATSMIKDSFCFHEPIAAHGQIRQKKVREALDPLIRM
jgi:hypothetical protein